MFRTVLMAGAFVLLGARVARANDLEDKWEGKTVYTKTNLRFEAKKELHAASTNFQVYPELLPAGTKLKVTEVSGKAVTMTAAGKSVPVIIDFNEKHSQMPFDEYLERTFSFKPYEMPAAFTPAERQAIAEGVAKPGMSRGAVLVALGYPPGSLNPSFDGKTLVYQRTRFARMTVTFDDAGKVKSVEGGTAPEPQNDGWTGKTVYAKVGLRAKFDDPAYEYTSTNYIEYSKHFPAGTEFTVTKLKKAGMVLRPAGGKADLEITFESGHSQMPFEEFLGRTFAFEKPVLPSTLSSKEKDLIKSGRVEAGMGREAVFLAVGYPPGNLNPSMDGERLVYMKLPAQKVIFHFDKKGQVSKVEQ